jgi:hypothetical protein
MAKVWAVLMVLGVVLAGRAAAAADVGRRALEYAPAAVDNPLKGLVPYAGDVRERFPHSMEFNYLPLSAVVTGPGRYDWSPLERLLDPIAGRGHQAVFRVYLEYPGKASGVPAFLIEGGLKVHRYRVAESGRPVEYQTPDYADPKLRAVLTEFIAALGRKYDGDPRIGFVTAGLLGAWGEWHTYPRAELFASTAVQAEVMDAYEAAFKTTRVLLRYPAGEGSARLAPNARRGFGYHDDSFAWATLATGKPGDSWFYMTALAAAGPDAVDKWKTQPIGGEIRPEAWGVVFDAAPGVAAVQDFRACVEATHASWMLDSGMFRRKQDAERIRRAEAEVRRMGYEFHVPSVGIARPADGRLAVEVDVVNRGVAPFYYNWPVELGLIGPGGAVAKTYRGSGKITGLLPGEPPRTWAQTLDLSGVPAGAYRVALRVANPLPAGHPIRFANATQDADATGWLTLGDVVLK